MYPGGQRPSRQRKGNCSGHDRFGERYLYIMCACSCCLLFGPYSQPRALYCTLDALREMYRASQVYRSYGCRKMGKNWVTLFIMRCSVDVLPWCMLRWAWTWAAVWGQEGLGKRQSVLLWGIRGACLLLLLRPKRPCLRWAPECANVRCTGIIPDAIAAVKLLKPRGPRPWYAVWPEGREIKMRLRLRLRHSWCTHWEVGNG